MASRRDLKKDINHMTYSVISECYNYLEFAPGLNYEDVFDIIREAVDLRNELISKTNHLEQSNENKEKLNLEFKDLTHVLYQKSIEYIERLNKLF